MKSGVFDQNGREIAIGDAVIERNLINGVETESAQTGIVEYVWGCHMINFGGLGTYTLWERHPFSQLLYGQYLIERRWEIVEVAK